MTDIELSRILREVVERIREEHPDIEVTGSVSQHCLRYHENQPALATYYVIHVVVRADVDAN